MFFKKMFKCAIILMTIFSCAISYRILGVFPIPGKSHYLLGSALLKGLAEAGHDVTIISPFKDTELPSLSKNGSYREIVLEEIEEKKFTSSSGKPSIQLGKKKTSVLNTFNNLENFFGHLGEETVKDKKVQTLIQSGEKFDVVIVSEFMNRFLRILAHHFDASLVLFTNSGIISWYYDQVGNIVLPSVVPVLAVEIPHRMSFLQRWHNVIEKIRSIRWLQTNAIKQNELVKKYFPNSPSLEEISKNISLVLVNSQYSTEVTRPKVPCMIEIGGFHVKPAKKLPKDLQQIMDDAKYGVILLSFGSMLDPKMIAPEKWQAVLQMFAKRKETILWKFSDDLPGKPKNVVIRKWLPQQDILAHPNLKLFITHSGYLSTIETTYHGVPTVMVPFHADQTANARFVEDTGSGVTIAIENFGADSLSKAIEEVISNPKYREAARQKSRIMHDRPIKPLDDAIFWIEYVVRHKGAKHLRVPYVDMPLYQIYMLDIIGLLFIGFIFVALSLVFIATKIFRCIKKSACNRKNSPNSQKKIN